MRSTVLISRLTIVLSCLALLSACSLLRRGDEGLLINTKDDYLDAEQHEQLVIPEDLEGLADTDPFPIPPIPESANAQYFPNRPPLPDAIYEANDNRNQVRLQRLGDRSWLVVPEPPTTAWPKLKQFLAENGVRLTLESPDVGRLNTEWLNIGVEPYRDVVRVLLRDAKEAQVLASGQDRFLIKVEQGIRPRTTEIHLRHENDSVSLPVRADLELIDNLNSHVPMAETDMLNAIGGYIAAKVSEQIVSKVARQIGSTLKTQIVQSDQGLPVLKLFLDYERAWATLSTALEKSEVEISETDREGGIFQVSVPKSLFDQKSGGGLFCRLTFSCGGGNNDYDLEIHVDNSADREYDVSVIDTSGDPADPELARQVLVLLRELAA